VKDREVDRVRAERVCKRRADDEQADARHREDEHVEQRDDEPVQKGRLWVKAQPLVEGEGRQVERGHRRDQVHVVPRHHLVLVVEE